MTGGLLAFLPAMALSQVLPPSTQWRETVDPSEADVGREFARDINGIQDETAADDNLPLGRGFHTKTHAVMLADFKVMPDLPSVARQGVFANPGQFKAWVRFTNLVPARRPDSSPDFRAIALKILDVPGAPLTPGATSLDLMGLNHPLQPARNLTQFTAFVRGSRLLREPKFGQVKFMNYLRKQIGFMEAARMVGWMSKNLKAPVPSLASRTFWSTIPIAYGDHAIKYRFTPKNGGDTTPNLEDPHYLRNELLARLKTGPLSWDFSVQFFRNEEITPIEDAVVVWDPAVAPFIKVGELTITQRDLESLEGVADETLGEQMLFNAWHAPEAHRPLGGLQRARRIAYKESGRHRSSTLPAPGSIRPPASTDPSEATQDTPPRSLLPDAWEGLHLGPQ